MTAPRSFVEEYAHLPVIDLAFLRARGDRIAAIKRRRGVVRLLVFGSVARGEPRPDSDIDFAVDLAPDADRSWMLGGLYTDLQDLVLGRRIDLFELDPDLTAGLRAEIEREGVEL